MALAQYSELFWFPSGELAASVPARVFLHETNTLAVLYADAGGTTPLANPLSTSGVGRLEFYVEEGRYWVHIDSEAFEIAVGDSTIAATLADINDAVAAHSADTTGVHGIADTSALETQAGATAKAADAGSAAASHADDLNTAMDARVDALETADAQDVKLTGDQVIAGEKTFADRIPVGPGFDPEFDNQLARKAYVDAVVAAGGGGATIRTATARVADGDATATLAPAAAWTIVQSSVGTQLKASIAADPGDRIVAHPAFMRTPGPHFLDLALLDNTGAIALYAGSRSSTPLIEGNPTMYPANSFAYVPGSVMFTVGAGHIDGTGKATIALVYKGSETTMKVYATPDYPWEMRLENTGPEPS